MFINLFFGATALVAVYLFYQAANRSKVVISVIGIWLLIQLILGLSPFYKMTNTLPPRIMLAILFPVLVIIGILVSTKGKAFIDRLDITLLTYLHTIRIPVELVLFWLFIYGKVPQLMTFEGRNFDVIIGLSAPLIAYFGFQKKKLSKVTLLSWNMVGIGFLLFIVVNATLSTPTPLQKFGFDQPNIAILHFPFVWLPSCIVPIVLFSHLASIRKLLTRTS